MSDKECNSKFNYYQDQIDSVIEPELNFYRIKITSKSGKGTNWMNITPNQLAQIREILKEKE